MNEVSVITGAGSGIGRALARRLAAAGYSVLIVGRRSEALAETVNDRGTIEVVTADIANAHGRLAVIEAVGGRRVRFLVHNAGVLTPVGALSTLEVADWRHNQAVNVEGPLFLTQGLVQALRGGRVLHISSGAAHRPVPGWGAYCVAKAALHRLYTVWRDELREQNVAVGSARPGVVDTDMQAFIRAQDEGKFPAVERFRALKTQGRLETPERVAAFLMAILTQTDPERFGAREWDINEHAGHFDLD